MNLADKIVRTAFASEMCQQFTRRVQSEPFQPHLLQPDTRELPHRLQQAPRRFVGPVRGDEEEPAVGEFASDEFEQQQGARVSLMQIIQNEDNYCA